MKPIGQIKTFLVFLIVSLLLVQTFQVSFGTTLYQDIKKLKGIKRDIRGYGNRVNDFWFGGYWNFLDRLGTANYDDTKKTMRVGPHPRTISNRIGEQSFLNIKKSEQNLSMLWVLFGQFVDHDISHIHDQYNETKIEMAPIIIPQPLNGQTESYQIGTSLGFIRSSSELDSQGVRQQHSGTSSYLDLSPVYGVDRNNLKNNLRLLSTDPLQRGKLRVTDNGKYKILPKTNGNFKSGDWRFFVNYVLQALHIMFHNFHNHMCDQVIALDTANQLTQDDVFQIAKNLNIGIFEHIVYDHYLPILIGQSNVGIYPGYSNQERPFSFQEFSVAAMRFGHSMLHETIKLVNDNGILEQEAVLDFLIGNKFKQKADFLAQITRGSILKTAKERSCTVVDQIRNVNHGDGEHDKMDVYAFDIQRGRDHGLPTYGDLKSQLGQGLMTSFSGFTGNTSVDNTLTQVFQTPNKMDLIVGIHCEQDQSGSLLGPVGTKIVTENFKRVRKADRFWYQRKSSGSTDIVFSPTLISKIKEFSFRDVVLNSMPNLASEFANYGWYSTDYIGQ